MSNQTNIPPPPMAQEMDTSNEQERTDSGSKQARGFTSIFSPSVEESLRLRGLALASLWVASIGLAWAGGDFRLALLAGGLGTLGYWDGWRWRHRKSLLRSVLIVSISWAIAGKGACMRL